jgi:hypothetical protein
LPNEYLPQQAHVRTSTTGANVLSEARSSGNEAFRDPLESSLLFSFHTASVAAIQLGLETVSNLASIRHAVTGAMAGGGQKRAEGGK